MAFIESENLVKIYKVAELEVLALQGLDISIEKGEMIGIVGASGSGKSTFLNVLGGLDRPSAGRIIVDKRDLLKLSDEALDAYRREDVGFVWQQPARNLLPYLTAENNVMLPMTIAAFARQEKLEWTQELLEAVGLWKFRHHKLTQLSGGQQQRVAIAVALANRPKLLLGDEPTGELDSVTSDDMLALFRKLNEQYALTTVLVTHDPAVSRAVDRVVTIRDGRTSSETVRRTTQSITALGPASVDGEHYDEYVVVDGVGRLQIPPDLREQIALGDRVTLSTTEDGAIVIRPVDRQENGRGPTIILSDEQPPPEEKGWRRWFKRIGN